MKELKQKPEGMPDYEWEAIKRKAHKSDRAKRDARKNKQRGTANMELLLLLGVVCLTVFVLCQVL